MKIHFDNVDLATRSGPSSFANRLARRLFESGHEVCTTSFGADVSLVFIERSGADVADVVVQRLDGIWFKPNEFQNRNTGIKRLYESADAVIWQSNFDSEMTKRWWGVPRRGTVIHNGVDVSVKHEITIPVLAQLRNVYDRIFVCSANWHAQKRLIDNVNLFQTQLKYHPKSCLIIMGNNPDVRIASPNVYYTGSLEHDACLQVYAISNWMFHLAWCDHCPNVVCEALSQGTPVVCASSGGLVAWGLFLEATSISKVFGGMMMVFAFGVSVIYTNSHILLKKWRHKPQIKIPDEKSVDDIIKKAKEDLANVNAKNIVASQPKIKKIIDDLTHLTGSSSSAVSLICDSLCKK